MFSLFSGDSKEKRLTGSKSSRSAKERSNRSWSRDRKDKDKGDTEELPFDHTKLDKVSLVKIMRSERKTFVVDDCRRKNKNGWNWKCKREGKG